MSENVPLIYTYTVDGNDLLSAGAASSDMKKKLKELGLPKALVKRIAIAVYEAEINMVIHADGGKTKLTIEKDCVKVDFSDNGPGIDNLSLAMTDGWTTASQEARNLGFGAGMGLGNIERNVDNLEIQSESGKGTVLKLIINTSSEE